MVPGLGRKAEGGILAALPAQGVRVRGPAILLAIFLLGLDDILHVPSPFRRSLIHRRNSYTVLPDSAPAGLAGGTRRDYITLSQNRGSSEQRAHIV